MIGIITSKHMLNHERPYPFIECPERLKAIFQFLLQTNISYISLFPKKVNLIEINECHNIENILVNMKKYENIKHNYSDNYVLKDKTLNAALYAAGCSISLIENIIANRIQSGFAFVRPPGHHAKENEISGFCIFNNSLLAAVTASKKVKVCIFDFDVHFNDGTYEILKNRQYKNLSSVSIHRSDNYTFYPYKTEAGIILEDNILNIGFDGSINDDKYLKLIDEHVLPFMKNYNPELIIVSAGFDAANGDDIGGCHITPNGYRKIINRLKTITPRIALILEGGYHIPSLILSIEACLNALYD